MAVGIPAVWFAKLSALTLYTGVSTVGEFAAIPMATLKLAARIHTDVGAAAWREYKQTHLYNFLLTKIFFSTGMLLFYVLGSERRKKERQVAKRKGEGYEVREQVF